MVHYVQVKNGDVDAAHSRLSVDSLQEHSLPYPLVKMVMIGITIMYVLLLQLNLGEAERA